MAKLVPGKYIFRRMSDPAPGRRYSMCDESGNVVGFFRRELLTAEKRNALLWGLVALIPMVILFLTTAGSSMLVSTSALVVGLAGFAVPFAWREYYKTLDFFSDAAFRDLRLRIRRVAPRFPVRADDWIVENNADKMVGQIRLNPARWSIMHPDGVLWFEILLLEVVNILSAQPVFRFQNRAAERDLASVTWPLLSGQMELNLIEMRTESEGLMVAASAMLLEEIRQKLPHRPVSNISKEEIP